PPTSSTAGGSGTLTLNADNTVTYDISYSGLAADFLAAHIHGPAGPGTNAPVIVPLTNVPTDTRSGALRGTTGALTGAQVADLTNGLNYANIHSGDFQGGEIRGQILVGGPFDAENWPLTIASAKVAHFVSVDQSFSAPGASWSADALQILGGGDQETSSITIGGHTGLKVTGNYLNVADQLFQDWANYDTIDILMQVYGDAALLGADGQPRNFVFLTGSLPDLHFPNGGSLPVEAKNKKWNWVLFRIENATRADGTRYVGVVPSDAQGATAFGGVNGGTIRAEGVPNLIVRLVAFGERGAFGEPDQINRFAVPESCAFHLVLLNDGDQTVTYQDNVGPAGDSRRAVRASGSFMNFGIADHYLGLPCNDPRNIKLCVEFYDDPALAGAVFGPEAYATDATGGTAVFDTNRLHTLEGTGKWVRRAFNVAAVDLKGINTGSLEGGPRLIFENGQVFVSRVELGIFRTGTNALAGVDPVPDCFEDPKICTDAYGNYAELDLGSTVKPPVMNGLDVGTSGGDQLMAVEEAGPASDRRQAVRPDGTPGIYLNFAINNEPFGPSTQDNARLAICATYYDDPALVGATLRPEVYKSDRGGLVTFAFTSPDIAVRLTGSDRWLDAYFEIPDMKFEGVNQGPQAAARFAVTKPAGSQSLPGVYVTRLRYAVIRPCGPTAGVNLLEGCKPPVLHPTLNPGNVTLFLSFTWTTNAVGYGVQMTTDLALPQWTNLTLTPDTRDDHYVVLLPITNTQAFYRLAR
ncbi:MAG: CHRD domain-containing protein, partial [Verrucomicrobia bacterium]